MSNHETELAKIDTRFYWFEGAWGNHQAILVDTFTDLEYEIVDRSHLTAPYTAQAVSEARVVAFARQIAGNAFASLAGSHPGQTFSRQSLHRGATYRALAV